MMKLTKFLPLLPRSGKTILAATVGISAGDATEISAELERIDFNEELTHGRDDVFLTHANGDSMEAEIFHGDWLIINRGLQPNAGDIVVARVGADYTVKIYSPCRNGLRLVASNEKYATRFVNKKEDCEIFGVVMHVVHRLKKI
ncbi:MAG: S24 family peptidase [Acidobacteria bacterium]|jgi:DNA polymerase V|nr:S24 family peptidase [Acidobacteriota bacterium]